MIILRQKKFSYGRMEVARVKEMVKNGQIKPNQAAIQSWNRGAKANVERKKRTAVKIAVDTVNNPLSSIRLVAENPLEVAAASPLVPGGIAAVPAIHSFKPYRKVVETINGPIRKIPGYERITKSKGFNIFKNPYEKPKRKRS